MKKIKLKDIETMLLNNLSTTKFFGEEEIVKGPWEKDIDHCSDEKLAFKCNNHHVAFTIYDQIDKFVHVSTCYNDDFNIVDPYRSCSSLILNMNSKTFEPDLLLEKIYVLDALISVRDSTECLINEFSCFEEYFMPYKYTINLIEEYINALAEDYSNEDLRLLFSILITNFKEDDEESLDCEFKVLGI